MTRSYNRKDSNDKNMHGNGIETKPNFEHLNLLILCRRKNESRIPLYTDTKIG